MAGPWVMPAMMAATEAGGAGMAAAASAAAAEAAAAALASGVATSAIPGIASTAAGSAVPGAALPAMQAAGTQGLAGAMGNMAPVYTAGVNTAGLAGPTGTGSVMGTVLPGMNQGANLLTTPLAKAIDSMGPMGKALGNAGRGWQLGQKLAGQQQSQARQPMAPAPAPSIPQSSGSMQRLPSPAQIAAYDRVKNRQKMRELMQQRGGMMA